jgi:intein-encoded DNA endonuclease-like protein
MTLKERFNKDKELYCNMYNNGLSVTNLMKILKSCGRTNVLQLLRDCGIIIRKDNLTCAKKYSLIEDYFEIIDSEEKAYFLGLIYADGNLSKKSLRICLQEEDKYILEKLLTLVNSNSKLKKIEPRGWSKKIQYKLDLYSKKLFTDLINKGAFETKSLILKFPTEVQVPTYLTHHFVRGYFDGDGCITKNNKRDLYVSFTGTFEFLTSLQQLLIKELGYTIVKFSKRKNDESNNYTFVFGGNLKIGIFYKWLYKDATIYLSRKLEKFVPLYGNIH